MISKEENVGIYRCFSYNQAGPLQIFCFFPLNCKLKTDTINNDIVITSTYFVENCMRNKKSLMLKS